MLTEEQKQITEKAVDNTLIVVASAGTGKTFTSIRAINNIVKEKPDSTTRIFTFNRINADEWREKIKNNGWNSNLIKADTFHALSLQYLPQNVKSLSWKVNDGSLISQFVKKETKFKNIFYTNYQYVLQLVDLIQLYNISNINEIDRIAERHQLPDYEEYKELAWEYLKKVEAKFKFIETGKKLHPNMGLSLTNSLYYFIKFVPDNQVEKFDYVFMDEFQDINPLYFEILKKVKKPEGNFFVVGDPKQAINSFQGSFVSPFDSFKNYLKENNITFEVLTLTETFRNSKKIVEKADTVFGTNTKTSISGGTVGIKSYLEIGKSGKDEVVLCYHNKVLYQLYSHLISSGINANFATMDFGMEDVKKLTNTLKFDTMSELVLYFERVCDMIDPSRLKNPKGNFSKITWAIYHDIKNRYTNQSKTLLSLAKKFGYLKKGEKVQKKEYNLYLFLELTFRTLKEGKGFNGINQALDYIESIWSKPTNLTLSTIHKYKGLECDTVYLLDPKLLIQKEIDNEREISTKTCLNYVAITRAKKEFYEVIDFNEEKYKD